MGWLWHETGQWHISKHSLLVRTSCKLSFIAKKRQAHTHFGSICTKIGIIQRRLAWYLHEDGTHICEGFCGLCSSQRSFDTSLVNTQGNNMNKTTTCGIQYWICDFPERERERGRGRERAQLAYSLAFYSIISLLLAGNAVVMTSGTAAILWAWRT